MLSEMNYQHRVKAQISYALTVICLIVVGIQLAKIPNQLDIENIKATYFADISLFTAETSEKMQYIVLTVLFPILYIIFSKLMCLINIKRDLRKIWGVISICTILAVTYLFYYVNAADPFVFQISLAGQNALLLFVLLPMCFFSFWIYQSLGVPALKIANWVLYAIPIILILLIGYIYVNPSFQQIWFLSYHTDAYYYPILKVNSGLTPGIDFNSLYGFYPYFFSFILLMLGNTNNLLHFSIIVAALLAVSLYCFYRFIYIFIANKLIACFTFIALLFPISVYVFSQHGAPYLQYAPHRILFPAIFLYYLAIYTKTTSRKKKRILMVGGYIVSSFAIVWNFETGIIVLAAQVLMLGYELLYNKGINKRSTKNILLNFLYILAMAGGAIALSAAFIDTITFFRTGKIIQIQDFLSSQLLFYGAGFGMIRMPLFHPWIILVLIYSISLAKSLNSLFFTDVKSETSLQKNIVYFILPILGMGLFSYYQGRSHNDCFIGSSYLGVVILGVLVDHFERSAKTYPSEQNLEKVMQRAKLVLSAILLCTIALTTVFYMVTNKDIWSYLDKTKLQNNSTFTSNFELVNEMTNSGKIELDYFVPMESYYYEKFATKDVRPFPALTDLVTYEDYGKIFIYLEKTDKSFVIENEIFKKLKNYDAIRWEKISSRFSMVSYNGMKFFYLPKDKLSKTYICSLGEGMIGQEKLGSDTWIWNTNESNFVFENLTTEKITLNISFTAQTPTDKFYSLVVVYAGKSQTYNINNGGTNIVMQIMLIPGTNVLSFSTDAPKVDAPNDPRQMYFKIVNFKIAE